MPLTVGNECSKQLNSMRATTSVSTYGLSNHNSVNKATMKISENTAKKPIFFILSGRFISTPFPYNEDIHHKFEHRAIIYSTTDR